MWPSRAQSSEATRFQPFHKWPQWSLRVTSLHHQGVGINKDLTDVQSRRQEGEEIKETGSLFRSGKVGAVSCARSRESRIKDGVLRLITPSKGVRHTRLAHGPRALSRPGFPSL